jgi:hypothetical protein
MRISLREKEPYPRIPRQRLKDRWYRADVGVCCVKIIIEDGNLAVDLSITNVLLCIIEKDMNHNRIICNTCPQ